MNWRSVHYVDRTSFTFAGNLSIYWQDGTRRHIIDNPKRDRIENYESVNEAYVVEDFDGVALIENIEFGDFSAPKEG